MARVSRLIIYDSDDEDKLTKQIEKSLPEGIYHLAVKITVITLPDEPELNNVVKEFKKLNNLE